jgi:hypothetical protein
MHDDQPIPLDDGNSSGAGIIHYAPSNLGTTVRGRRASSRRICENMHICFSPEMPSGRIDHAECPLLSIAVGGIDIEYDQFLAIDTRARVAYRAATGRPVDVGCSVRRCDPRPEGRYCVGLKLDRKLLYEETKPARLGIGREVAPGIRARKLRSPDSDAPNP